MMISIQEELMVKKTALIVIPSVQYPDTIMDLTMQINANYSRVAYVSLNKLILPLRRSLEEKNIDLHKFFFIDGITMTAIASPPQMENVIFVPSPNDLTKLSISATKALQNFDPDCIFFDSLSTLLIYEDNLIISQFVHSLINKINAYGVRGIFTCLKGEKEDRLER